MNQPALRILLAVYIAIFIAFLYGPFLVMGIISFQQGPEGGPQFPIIEWSTFWYKHVLGLAPPTRVAPLPIGEALTRSLTLAFATMVVATVLGTLTAQAFRTQFKGSGFVFYLVVLGMMVPGVLLGLGMSLVANQLGVQRTWWGTAFVLHVVYTFPFAFLVMLAIFNRFDQRVEEAAWALGVTPMRTFRKVTFPIIFPGVLSAMLFAFTLSYDEFPRTLFTGGPDVTMPIAIYGTFSVEIHPNLFAFGVLTTLFSFTLLTIYGVLMTASIRRSQAKASGIQEDIE
ncbi:ABC transporter permease subunit [Sulfitobacter sp. JBTF-M27]|uniref:ABC transporter permease subunit n=1 Tax=Sulfitobacter sediminilitoris TaxID=2698830 RepID=A0A6P0CBC4_9RHOB|nr:ABC transporter permease [Sulfitobacter sediminilitoris]NEK23452.1 ABC transporter permease subunit [Sulfitobacter sediminilitoris]